MATNVWVASFSPAGTDGGAGGFIWAPDRPRAEAVYDSDVQDSEAAGGTHVVRLVQIAVESDPVADRTGVTDEIDRRLDEVESTLAAHRQYVPADAHYVPEGGVL
ncbi:hypothetical protein MUG78_17785 [Gordonia alkaliphila]|uniref:hypothetical protein n=1 Tax=Gordonia alkaliphila TaxID=1053547 RepID=UPI001FF671D6|nr:hypothetical protein [Gordonia alkaliphila]MCK0441253.1 hypothetical protein [Gordonia alkaliphila]